jgi:hypothetical protein
MRTIKLEITLTERESMLLDWAATPLSPEHVRLLVLREAARVVRNDIAFTLDNAQARLDGGIAAKLKAMPAKRAYHSASRSIEHDANGAEP